ncbi:hypothetical protein GCM10023353_16150 [Tomitella cavernea]|uniref:Lipoprotein n=1 Tax=Tomitella cavernea TaxID=1387982 RepID=A0ABP9CPP0_9ACTN
MGVGITAAVHGGGLSPGCAPVEANPASAEPDPACAATDPATPGGPAAAGDAVAVSANRRTAAQVTANRDPHRTGRMTR